MKGADEYYDLFDGESQQLGRLYLQLRQHARGKCFEIKLMPDGMVGSGDYVAGKDVVEVYGMVSGQRGWTEAYDWIHVGKWKDDFLAIVEQKKLEKAQSKDSAEKIKQESNDADRKNTQSLLAAYT